MKGERCQACNSAIGLYKKIQNDAKITVLRAARGEIPLVDSPSLAELRNYIPSGCALTTLPEPFL